VAMIKSSGKLIGAIALVAFLELAFGNRSLLAQQSLLHATPIQKLQTQPPPARAPGARSPSAFDQALCDSYVNSYNALLPQQCELARAFEQAGICSDEYPALVERLIAILKQKIDLRKGFDFHGCQCSVPDQCGNTVGEIQGMIDNLTSGVKALAAT